MWQRWNQTTHIFEKSTDNGSSWTPLGLSGAIITEGTIPNVAYKNIDNAFVAQTFATGNWIVGTNSLLYFHDTAAAADQKLWRMLGTGGNFLIQAFNDAITVNTGSQIFYRDGAFSATNWVRAGGGFFEMGRGIAQGQRSGGWTPTVYTAEGANCGGSLTGYFSLIGYQLFWSVYCVNISIPAATGYLRIALPPGYPTVIQYVDQPVIRGYIPGIADEPCYTQIDPGAIQVYRMKGVAWPVGVGHVIGQGFYWIG